jgi:hypothetical protein
VTSQDSPDRGLFLKTLRTLERLNVPYMVVGAFAATLYGLNRSTFDIDIVVDLAKADLASLAGAFPLPRYYADLEQMRDSIRRGMPFSIIDATAGEKADLVPLGRTGRDCIALGRRRRRSIEIPGQPPLAFWCASPEDVIVGKLAAWSGRPGDGRARAGRGLCGNWCACDRERSAFSLARSGRICGGHPTLRTSQYGESEPSLFLGGQHA